MSKKSKSSRLTHVKEAHVVVQEAITLAGKNLAAKSNDSGQLDAHKRIADAVEVSTSLLYKWREPPKGKGSGQPNPLDRVAKLIVVTQDDRIVDWLAQKAGGHFLRHDTLSLHPELNSACSTLIKEFSLLIVDMVSAVEDQEIDCEESQHLREKWNALRKRTEAFVQSCEKGDFGKGKK
jgi:hypothetical protein